MKFFAIKKISVILAISVVGIFFISADGQEVSKTELENRAFENFKAEKYDKASADFEVLYDLFPRDSRYAYYLGRSYFHSNQKLDEATELLKFAAARNYGDDTYYYLGRAYHLNYKFEDAVLAFLTFNKTAKNSEIKKYNIEYWINVSENAKESVKIAQELSIVSEKSVPENALESTFDDELNGSYIYVPDAFRSEADIEMNYQTLMFLPDNPQIGEYIYFESNSKKGNTGLDLYRVQILSAENFSIPEPLPDFINTEFDEAYPYFDVSESVLYFSSRGHNTTGGYDIFKCIYDSSKSAWASVEKLYFPVNTPNDEILFANIADRSKSVFLSNRNTGLNEYIAYTFLNEKQAEYLTLKNREEIMLCAQLADKNELDNISVAFQKYEQGTLSPEELSKFDAIPDDKYGYEQLLTEALIYQSRSDSLAWIVKDLQAKVDKEEDYQKKQVLIANSATIDRESKRLQTLADEKFLLAEQNTDPTEEESGEDDNPYIQMEDDINGIAVYSYSEQSDQDEIHTADNNRIEYNKGKETAKKVQSDFTIQQTSPYSMNNPIPLNAMQGGLVYKIQLGSFSQSIPEDTFRGLSPISKEVGDGSTKYYVGNFRSLKEVRKALEKVKDYGFPDAFIVSFNNNQKINIQKAKEIEYAKK